MISGLVLAAGLSTRMGMSKQRVRLSGREMLDYAIEAFLSSNVDEVIVIVDRQYPRGRRTEAQGPRYLVNPDPSRGLSSSIRLGLEALGADCKAVVIGLGDEPLVQPSTIDALIAAYEKHGSTIVIPTFGGIRGNPVLFHESLFVPIMNLEGDVGAKEVIQQNSGNVLEVEVEDEGILLDVDTPFDMGKVEAALGAGKLLHRRESRK